MPEFSDFVRRLGMGSLTQRVCYALAFVAVMLLILYVFLRLRHDDNSQFGPVTFKLQRRDGVISVPQYDYSFQFLPVSDKPLQGLKAEPKYRSKTPLYGELEIGVGPDNKIAVVVDDVKGEEPRLYIDCNRDRDLTNDGSGKPNATGRWSVAIDAPYPSGSVSYPIEFLRWSDRPDRLAYRATSYREGEIELNGNRYKIALQSERFNGRFDNLNLGILVVDMNQDGVLEDERATRSDDSSAEVFKLSEPFNVHGKVWKVDSVSPDGLTIALRPSAAKVREKPYLTPGNKAPDFTARGLNGKPIHLKQEVAKAKYVLLHFWMSSSSTSRDEFPNLRKLYAQYENHGLQIVGVSHDRNRNAANEIVKRFSLTYPHVFEGKGNDGSVKQLYRVLGYSQTWLIKNDMTIVANSHLHGNNLRGDELAAKLRELLGPGDEHAAAKAEKDNLAEKANAKPFVHDPSTPKARCKADGFSVTIVPRPSSWDQYDVRAVALRLPYVYVMHRWGGRLFIAKVSDNPKDKEKAKAVREIEHVGDGTDLIIIGDALLCPKSGGIAVYSLADPENPQLVKTVPADSSTDSLSSAGFARDKNHLVVLSKSRFSVFDVTQPLSPRYLATMPFQSSLSSGCAVEGRLYASSSDGIATYDITKPLEPKAVGSTETSDRAYHLLPVDSNRMVVLTDKMAALYSIEDPLKPTQIGSPVRLSRGGRTGAVMAARGQQFLITNGEIFTIEPQKLKKYGSFTAGGNPDGFPYRAAVEGNCAAITSSAFVALLVAESAGPAGNTPPTADAN